MSTELHCHSNYSFQEGASSISELLARADELGYRSLALTDHDNLCGAMEFARTATSLSIQPITGAELTLADGGHLTFLAENHTGYSNLCQLISYAHIHGDPRNPALDPSFIPELAEGLILLTGCRKGEISSLLMDGRKEEAEEEAKRYLDWFGPDNVYVEIQQNLAYGDTKRNRRLATLAHDLGIRMVATGNVHYHVQERHRLQDALVAIRHNKRLDETHRERRPNDRFYLRHPDEMAALFQDYPEAITNASRIADRCFFDLTRNLDYRFPDYPIPDGHTPQDHLENLCQQAAIRRYGKITEKVRVRLEREFHLVRQHNLSGFLLIYHHIIQIAREIMIELGLTDWEIPMEERPPGRGRGSSVAMLIGYLIGLSHIDPLEFDLSLDRFINDEMPTVPDIDLDFPRDIREELIKRVHQKWGWDRAALTGMISTYKMRGIIRDLGKALGLPTEDLNKLAKRVDSHRGGALESEMLALPEFRDKVNTPAWRHLIALAEQLDGFPKYLAQHPGGMIISSFPLTHMVPIQKGSIEERFICHWDKDSIDDAGFVKIDFLALGTLSQMQEALKLIEERTGRYIDLSRIDFDDKAVYAMLHRADTIGIFQVESAAQMQTITRIRPRNLIDMSYEVAAVRPGVGVNDGVTLFIQRRNNPGSWNFDHPLETKALERTLGVILFQDQVNQVAMDVAGFSAIEADQLRRSFSRRNNTDLVERYRVMFIERSMARGVEEAIAEKIFAKFNGQYMFPESHAFAFGVTAYHMSWLKHYYPLEFFVAIFNQQPMGFYNLETLKEDAKRHGVPVFKPDINESMQKSTITVRSHTSSASALTDNKHAKAPYLFPRQGKTKTCHDPDERIGESRGDTALSIGIVSEERTQKSFFEEKEDRVEKERPSIQNTSSDHPSRGGLVISVRNSSKSLSSPVSSSLWASTSKRGTQAMRDIPPKKKEEALLLGFLHVKGIGPTTADAIVEARKRGGPFASIADVMERTELQRDAVDNLIMAGAFDSLTPDRRSALWEVGLRYRPSGGQSCLPLPVEQDMADLPPFDRWETMMTEYHALGLYPEGHLMSALRPHLSTEVLTSTDIHRLEDGEGAIVAGLVIRRQRPLGKTVFISLEDEFGHIPLIIWPKVYEQYRQVLKEPLLKVHGTVSRRDGTFNITVTHVKDLVATHSLPSARNVVGSPSLPISKDWR